MWYGCQGPFPLYPRPPPWSSARPVAQQPTALRAHRSVPIAQPTRWMWGGSAASVNRGTAMSTAPLALATSLARSARQAPTPRRLTPPHVKHALQVILLHKKPGRIQNACCASRVPDRLHSTFAFDLATCMESAYVVLLQTGWAKVERAL